MHIDKKNEIEMLLRGIVEKINSVSFMLEDESMEESENKALNFQMERIILLTQNVQKKLYQGN